MKLSFYGGARALTGSCYMLEVAEQNILIDCGLQQGSDEFDDNALEFYASRVDCALVSHAHLDSAGRIPLLVKEGYYGRILTTSNTKRLMNLVLTERAEMLENMARWRNHKGLRSGISPIEPLYTREDVVAAMQQVETYPFDDKFMVCPGVTARFTPSGHMTGAAIIEIWATEGAETRKLVFSGDLGNKHMPYAPPPQTVDVADFLVLESTNAHETYEEKELWGDFDEFVHAIDTTLARGGNVIIPASAVGRTQEMLAVLGRIKREKLVTSVPHFPVYLDSFLAEQAVNLFEGDITSELGDLSVTTIQGEQNPMRFPDLKFCKTQAESKALNLDRTPKVIIAGSGMCDRGRVRHHLKHNVWRKECAVLLVGFLGEGSMGKRLVDGIPSARFFGEEVLVRAKVLDFRGASSHGDRPQLVEWLQAITEKPKHVFVVHGEDTVAQNFATHLTELGYSAHAPLVCQVYDLITRDIIEIGIAQEKRGISRRGRTYSLDFIKLQDSIRLLDNLAHEGRWNSSEEFVRMNQQVLQLIDAWQEKNNEKRR